MKKGFLLLVFFILLSCGEESTERKLRRELGIPDSAKKVLIIGQSSHLDPDWLLTFDEYYDKFVRRIILSSLHFISLSPLHYYSLAEVSFIKRFYEESPADMREELRRRIREGRFVILGGGFSSPDTLLPGTEAIIMNYFHGIKWLKENIYPEVRPRSMWLPDDFGHSPLLPDLAASMGFRYAGFARVDGLGTTLEEFGEGTSRPSGSTAELLERERAIDFVWKGLRGKVIAHWMPFSLYCEGDNIDIEGQTLPGGFLGVYMGFDRNFTNKRLKEYIEKLEPLSPTPYMFLSTGCDFTLPKMNLHLYARRWNEDMFEKTGVWVAVGSFEHFMRLVEFHRDKLKEFSLDINPYFMGFYASRPYLKELYMKATGNAIALEALKALLHFMKMEESNVSTDGIWEKIGFAAHHDFITGTSPLRVVQKEQIPVLSEVIAETSAFLNSLLSALGKKINTAGLSNPLLFFNPYPGSVSGFFERNDDENRFTEKILYSVGGRGFIFKENGRIYGEVMELPPAGYRVFDPHEIEPSIPFSFTGSVLITPFYTLEENRISRGDEILWELGPFRVYHDDGGLWRMGGEMKGCSFYEKFLLQPSYSASYLSPLTGMIESRISYPGNSLSLKYLFYRSLPVVRILAGGIAMKRETITLSITIPFCRHTKCSFHTSVPPYIFERPAEKIFSPTFWSSSGKVVISSEKRRFIMKFNRATGVRWNGADTVEIVTHRNAPVEKCESLGLVTEETGMDPYPHTFEILLTETENIEGEIPFVLPLTPSSGEAPPEFSLISAEGCIPTIFKTSGDLKGYVLRVIFTGEECRIATPLELMEDKIINSLEEEEMTESIVKNFFFIRK